MSELFEKSIRTLELPAVLEMLSAKAVSEAARERCRRITPATEREDVLRLLDLKRFPGLCHYAPPVTLMCGLPPYRL